MKHIKELLKFLAIMDTDSKQVSITNVAVIVIITKIALSPFDWISASTLLIALLNYSHKRYESNKAQKNKDELEVIEDVPLSSIVPLATQEDLIKLRNELSEVKDKASKLSLSIGLKGGANG